MFSGTHSRLVILHIYFSLNAHRDLNYNLYYLQFLAVSGEDDSKCTLYEANRAWNLL